MTFAPTAIADSLPHLAKLLPDAAPGITASQAHAKFDRWSPSTVRIALTVLERDGIAVSSMAPGPRRQPTRFFWRASP